MDSKFNFEFTGPRILPEEKKIRYQTRFFYVVLAPNNGEILGAFTDYTLAKAFALTVWKSWNGPRLKLKCPIIMDVRDVRNGASIVEVDLTLGKEGE